MKALLTCTLAALLCCCVQCGPFTIHISTKGEYQVGEDVECEMTITNTDSRDYYLLPRYTPLEGLRADIFSVSKNGREIPYDSIFMKRGPPSAEEYVLIKAKSSLVSSVDLSEAYSFDSAGVYVMQLEMGLQFRQDMPATQHVFSNTVEFSLTESQNEPKMTHGALARLSVLTLTDSSTGGSPKAPKLAGTYPSGNVTDTTKAYSLAYGAITKSMKSTTGNPTMYKTWFGAPYNSKVQDNYKTMNSSMVSKQFTLFSHPARSDTPSKQDTCEKGVFAFTYRGYQTIYLCDEYFAADLTGTDSKMGTIVHEMSHAVAYTDDVIQNGHSVYGQSGCKALAAKYPNLAIKNADNYEYFSEAQ